MAQRQAAALPPDRLPVMYQSWRHLLFLHWAWDPAEIQRSLPEGLYVDTFDGSAWLGVVPFWMDAIRPRWCPAVPGLSWFLELNLRTYVHTADGTPGVWFYSLDCNRSVAVWAARTFFSLPYVHATQSGVRPQGETGSTEFRSKRRGPSLPNAFTYGAKTGAVAGPALAGTLEYFLVERYRLFSWRKRERRLFEGQVSHTPYVISPARVLRADCSLFEENGWVAPKRGADHAVVSSGVDVSIYALR